MAFDSFLSRLRIYEILVEVDRALINPASRNIYRVDRLTKNTFLVGINQYQLIYAIGTIQTRRYNPSNRQKFIDKSDLIEKIKEERELKVDLSEIRAKLDSERLGKISEDFGVGVAVLVADYLYGLNRSTLVKIPSTGRRPDMKCLTKHNHEIIVESKGYSDYHNLMGQLGHATQQKNAVAADIHTVSLTLISEDEVCKNWFFDPPIINNEGDFELKTRLLKAEHYSAVFSFIGQSQLSKYFNYMGKKISDPTDTELINSKESLYKKIKNNYIKIDLFDHKYYGTIEQIDDEGYQFLGIDEELLSFYGFNNFIEGEVDKTDEKYGNFYYIYRDGICVGEIRNLEPLKDQLKNKKIKNYQEKTRITDIDTMNPLSFEKYANYLFHRNGYKVIKGNNETYTADLIVSKGNEVYYVELKQVSNTKKVIKMNNYLEDKVTIVITNGLVDDKNKNLIIIDRNQLKAITHNNGKLLDIIYNANQKK